MVFFGLEDEEYDRKYTDRQLTSRLFQYLQKNVKTTIMVIILLSISSILSGLIPLFSSRLLQIIEYDYSASAVGIIIILTISANFISWLLNYLRIVKSSRIVSTLLYDLQTSASDAVLRQDMTFFDKYPTGKIVSRVASDTQNFGEATELFMEAVSGLIVFIAVSIPLFLLNTQLALLFMLLVPLVFAIVLSIRKVARKKTLMGQKALAQVNAFVQENIAGIQIIKSFRQEKKIYENFLKINNQTYQVNLQRALVLNFLFPILYIIFGISTTLIFYFGSLGLRNGATSAADLYLFLQSLSTIFNPIFAIASFWPQFQSGLSAAERIFALIDSPITVKQSDTVPVARLKGKIEFQNLTFEYIPGKAVFDNFSLTIQPGESVAIVGHTGAGKSSLAKLIARFYEFQSGDIRIDDRSIREFDLESYRINLGIIPQTPFLWADTLENNVRYARPTATREEVLAALEKSGGADWVYELPQGLETDIRERGGLLSMGQRQLVVFSRTLLEDPAILILDEATASVDPFTETKIQEALEKTIKGRTSIIIAHRLWTVQHVDRILVLDHGKLIEEGSHASLMARGGFYAELYNTYFRHQSLEFIEQECSQL